MENFFKLKENNTSVSTEIMAGITTFLAMSYILFVNPAILSQTGMPSQAIFLATLFASAISTLFIGLFANVPYALAPGMGLNAFFTYTVVFSLGFTWQEALSMVFICGLFNILITVTKVRKELIRAIPEFLQHAISAGIGVFIGYIGIKNAGLLQFISDAPNIVSINGGPADATSFPEGVYTVLTNSAIVPELIKFNNPSVFLALLGLAITVILMIRNVKGAILIGILLTSIIAIPMGVTDLSSLNMAENSLGNAFGELGQTFLVIFTPAGLPSLFSDLTRLPIVLMTIFAFSLSDIFDTIGTFIGTGLKTGIFTSQDIQDLENSTGFDSKMDKALFGDAIGTFFGALLGTSNTTTYVESAAGIGAGGRTGLTSISTAVMFLLAMFLAPFLSLVPAAATAPALIIVGILMLASIKEIEWDDFSIAVPSFFTAIFMGLAYSISNGIAAGFITYGLIKLCKGEAKDLHPLMWISIILFLLNYGILAIL
ncbi:NCS2 family permease [Ignavigranum ruoffiae]|uniref:Putative MFS transporter, AGZA family, xanthine/uracil permease n=1 Tax=Ignavigranum ruoffiae TaxID=89093 RepID=A0A1H9AZN9_9LACT|nr:NCS2 family permease [Ignavigranum ruoffiae]UPQ85173.1 NCS2 family permease [Ignavigranum ruoffiae]SEP82226.1 putative MFS transporter, AGZA family, xanthine/uracil permease [Ignavigranum ruoffiae]